MLDIYTKTFSNDEQKTRCFELYQRSLNDHTRSFIQNTYDDASTDPKMNLHLDLMSNVQRNKTNLGVALQTKRVFRDMIVKAYTDSRCDFYFHSDSDYIFSDRWFEQLVGGGYITGSIPIVLTPFRREDGNEKVIGEFGNYLQLETFIGGAVIFSQAALWKIYQNWHIIESVFSYPDWDYHLSMKLKHIGIPILGTHKSLTQHIGYWGVSKPFATTNFVGELPEELVEKYNEVINGRKQ